MNKFVLSKFVKYSLDSLAYIKDAFSIGLQNVPVPLIGHTYLFLASRLLKEVGIGLNLIVYLLSFFYRFATCKNVFCTKFDVSVALMGL